MTIPKWCHHHRELRHLGYSANFLKNLTTNTHRLLLGLSLNLSIYPYNFNLINFLTTKLRQIAQTTKIFTSFLTSYFPPKLLYKNDVRKYATLKKYLYFCTFEVK